MSNVPPPPTPHARLASLRARIDALIQQAQQLTAAGIGNAGQAAAYHTLLQQINTLDIERQAVLTSQGFGSPVPFGRHSFQTPLAAGDPTSPNFMGPPASAAPTPGSSYPFPPVPTGAPAPTPAPPPPAPPPTPAAPAATGWRARFSQWLEGGVQRGADALGEDRGHTDLWRALRGEPLNRTAESELRTRASGGDWVAQARLTRDLLSSAGEHIGRAAGSDRVDVQTAEGLGAAKDLAGTTGVTNKYIKPIIEFAEMVAKSVVKLRDWTDTLHDNNMKFAEFSASMAAVKAETDVRRINYEQRRGDIRAESARTLSEGRDALSRSFAPFEDAIAKLINAFAGDTLKRLATAIEWLAKKWGFEPDKDIGGGGQLFANIRDFGEAEWTKTYGRPGRLP